MRRDLIRTNVRYLNVDRSINNELQTAMTPRPYLDARRCNDYKLISPKIVDNPTGKKPLRFKNKIFKELFGFFDNDFGKLCLTDIEIQSACDKGLPTEMWNVCYIALVRKSVFEGFGEENLAVAYIHFDYGKTTHHTDIYDFNSTMPLYASNINYVLIFPIFNLEI